MRQQSLIKPWHYNFLRTLCGHHVQKNALTDMLRTCKTIYLDLLFTVFMQQKNSSTPYES